MVASAGLQATTDARPYNRQSVVRLALQRGVLTRHEIASLSGLSKATVSRVVRELLADGVLVEGPTLGPGAAGRPTTALVLNGALGWAAGVSVSRTQCRFLAADVRGVETKRWSVPVAAAGPAELRDLVVAQLRTRLPGAAQQVAVTVGVPARVGADGLLLDAAGYAELEGHPLAAELSRELGAEVVVENDADLAILGEREHGEAAAGARTAVYLMIGETTGGGVYLSGAILHGRTGLVGEFGDLPVSAGVDAEQALRDAVRADDGRAEEQIVYFLAMVLSAAYSPDVIVLSQLPSVGGRTTLARVARQLADEIAAPPRLVEGGLGAGATVAGALGLSVRRVQERLLA
ncbi:ROK family transcriptional regulator [Jiangella anatolica]|uniref:ROK family transcriptional regulator n=1 Tax=Jiangella anatolica TaxID=2670374 RepID=A0A2W2B9S2_9ACTN|nr:ROK family protein [Jiangella anatolica]PZF81930.1 hypothetical protein C1I92_19080 [Jiangella anatolica]